MCGWTVMSMEMYWTSAPCQFSLLTQSRANKTPTGSHSIPPSVYMLVQSILFWNPLHRLTLYLICMHTISKNSFTKHRFFLSFQLKNQLNQVKHQSSLKHFTLKSIGVPEITGQLSQSGYRPSLLLFIPSEMCVSHSVSLMKVVIEPLAPFIPSFLHILWWHSSKF